MELFTENWQVLPAENSGNENAIFFAISDNYSFAAANVIMGLLEYAKETMKTTDIIIYHNGISERNMCLLRMLHANTYFVPMQFPSQWAEILEHPKTLRWGHFIICKFYGFELIKKYKTAILLDADMLIRGDISELFHIEEEIAWRRILAWKPNELLADLIAPGTDFRCGNSGLLVFTDKLRKYNIGIDSFVDAFQATKELPEGGVEEIIIAWIAYTNKIPVKELDVSIYNTSAVHLCADTKVVHFLDAKGVNTKPWSSLAAYLYYEDWVANHQKWLAMGGEDCIHFTKDDYYKLFNYDLATEVRKLKKQKKNLKQENTDISEKIKQLTLEENKLSKQIDTLEKLRSELIHENTELGVKNAELSKDLDLQKKENAALTNQNTKQAQKIEQLSNKLTDSITKNDLLSQKNAELRNENKKQFKQLQKRDDKIAALKDESKGKSKQIAKLEKQLSTMLNSKSWKLTKPLRWFTRLIKKLLHR